MSEEIRRAIGFLADGVVEVRLEEGCNEGAEEKAAVSGFDFRSVATPPGAEGVLSGVQPLPGVLDPGTFVRVKTEIGRCDICDRGKAVYRSREARAKVCEGWCGRGITVSIMCRETSTRSTMRSPPTIETDMCESQKRSQKSGHM